MSTKNCMFFFYSEKMHSSFCIVVNFWIVECKLISTLRSDSY